MEQPLTPSLLEELRQFSTCTVSNAIEKFEVRLRNAGFADSSIRCIFEKFPPMVGYAVTARVRTAEPPMAGRAYYERTDWWNNVLATPAPRVVVVEDVDEPPGVGSFVGEIHANILLSLGCAGLVTNGAVRGLNGVEPTGFQMFARNVTPSHAYSHLFEIGQPVEIGGLKIHPGDLLHGDRHGVLIVPKEIASQIPVVAAQIRYQVRRVISLCRSPDFSLEGLREVIKGMD